MDEQTKKELLDQLSKLTTAVKAGQCSSIVLSACCTETYNPQIIYGKNLEVYGMVEKLKQDIYSGIKGE